MKGEKTQENEEQNDMQRGRIKEKIDCLVGWLVGFYGISTFFGYLTPNPFL